MNVVLPGQVRLQRKGEIQAQKRSEKAAKEAAVQEAEMRSYKHVMKVSRCSHCLVLPLKVSSLVHYLLEPESIHCQAVHS